MKLIVITYPEHFDDELSCVNRLFANGLHSLHLRKPDLSTEELRQYLNGVDTKFHSRIVLHSAFELLDEFDFKGVHLNSKTVHLAKQFQEKNISISYSAHSFDEVLKWKDCMNYFFLSPIFDSISKRGYQSAFEETELKEFIHTHQLQSKLCALGGVDEKNIKQLKSIGFDYCAVLGAIWEQQSEKKIIQKFKQLHNETTNS